MTVDRRSPLSHLVVLVTGQALALAALGAAATRAPVAGAPWWRGAPQWFRQVSPLDALVVVTHRIALLVAAWLLVTTALHLVAGLTRVPALVRATAWAAAPSARRAVAALVVTAGVLAPTAAGADPRATGDAPGPVRDGRATTTTTTTTPVTTAATATTASTVATSPVGPREVVVQPGDSLWTIAALAVAADEATPVDQVPEPDISARWTAIRDANAPRLRSGDPSLIFPGEEVVLPE